MQEILKKLKRVLKVIYGLVINKKTLILTLGLFVYLNLKNHPKEVFSSDFLNLLKSQQLSSVTTYNKNFITFTQKNSFEKYFCHYFIQDMDNFNFLLNKNSINFTNLSDPFALLKNPIKRLYFSIFALSFATTSYITE
jgi:hypothetical protein